jgi:hypothetical protein
MQHRFIKPIIIGLLASLIPIIIISYSIKKDNEINNQKYKNFDNLFFVQTIIFFVLFNSIFIPAIENSDYNEFYYKGLIAGLLISSFGRFVMNIPTIVLKMGNPNWFHVYAIITWSIFYEIIDYLFYFTSTS